MATGLLHSLGGNAVCIRIVVSEDDVDVTLELRELINNKWGAQVSTTDQRISILNRFQGNGEIPQVVVNIGNNGNAHVSLVEVTIPGVALEDGQGFVI